MQYQVGDKWTYDDTDSYCLITKLEPGIIHAAIENINFEGEIEMVGHVPIDSEAFKKSVRKKVGTKPITPEYLEGYQVWKADNGGIWEIPIVEIVEAIFFPEE